MYKGKDDTMNEKEVMEELFGGVVQGPPSIDVMYHLVVDRDPKEFYNQDVSEVKMGNFIMEMLKRG